VGRDLVPRLKVDSSCGVVGLVEEGKREREGGAGEQGIRVCVRGSERGCAKHAVAHAHGAPSAGIPPVLRQLLLAAAVVQAAGKRGANKQTSRLKVKLLCGEMRPCCRCANAAHAAAATYQLEVPLQRPRWWRQWDVCKGLGLWGRSGAQLIRAAAGQLLQLLASGGAELVSIEEVGLRAHIRQGMRGQDQLLHCKGSCC
jgi:hypothetical protein